MYGLPKNVIISCKTDASTTPEKKVIRALSGYWCTWIRTDPDLDIEEMEEKLGVDLGYIMQNFIDLGEVENELKTRGYKLLSETEPHDGIFEKVYQLN